MNNTFRIALTIGLLAVIIISLFSLFMTVEVSDYQKNIETHRTEKDIWMSNDFSSPFLVSNTPFSRLSYYKPDKKYLIKAKVIKAVSADSVTLITNTGENQVYQIFGNAIFELDGVTCLLQLLKASDSDQLFLPFIDQSSGESTYGAGRYLDLDIPRNNELILDFNYAYNPYCAYTEMYSCPFPPRANVLSVAIKAGEKSFAK